MALNVIARTRNVSAACKAAGVSRSTYYVRLESDPEFRKRHDEAMWSVVEKVESAAFKSALKGSERQQQFLLKAWKPEIYNVPARVQHSGPNDGPIQFDAAGDLINVLDHIAARVESVTGTPSEPSQGDPERSDPVPSDDHPGGPEI